MSLKFGLKITADKSQAIMVINRNNEKPISVNYEEIREAEQLKCQGSITKEIVTAFTKISQNSLLLAIDLSQS